MDLINTGATTAETTTPPPSSSFSLAEHRKAKANGETAPAKPAVTEPKAAVDETPDTEVDADPDLRAAIDELEPPKKDETPAEKRARTLKHKEAARKGFETRRANKLTRLERENEDLRRRVTAPAGDGERRAASPATRPDTGKAETASDPKDPEPIFDPADVAAFAQANPNHTDPYAGAIAAHGRKVVAWERRQADRLAASEREQTQRSERDRQVNDRLSTHHEHARGQYRDYDATLAGFTDLLRSHPAARAVADAIDDALFSIDDAKVGGEVLYRLTKDVAATKVAISGGQSALLRHIGRIERDVLAEAAKKPAAATHVSAAPEPHKPVGAVSTGAPANPSSRTGTKLSLSEKREWERQHGRRSS